MCFKQGKGEYWDGLMGACSQWQAIDGEDSSEEKQPRGKWNKGHSSQDVDIRGGDRDPTNKR